MEFITETCADCDQSIHHGELPDQCITFDGYRFHIHLTDEEVMEMYLSLKELALHR